jgi:hypothetical protein
MSEFQASMLQQHLLTLDISVLFGTHSEFRGPSTPLEYATSHAMQDDWVAFVSRGGEGISARDWPVYSPGPSGLVREFGRDVAAQTSNTLDWESQCPEAFQP